jgi:hypothetical protein
VVSEKEERDASVVDKDICEARSLRPWTSPYDRSRSLISEKSDRFRDHRG